MVLPISLLLNDAYNDPACTSAADAEDLISLILSTLYALDSSWMFLQAKPLAITDVALTSIRILKQWFMNCDLTLSSSNLNELVRQFSVVVTHMVVLGSI